MSFFGDPNKEAFTVAPENVTVGKRVGFLEGFSQAWEAQVRGAAVFGIQEAMRNLDDEQARTLRQLGVEDVPSLSKSAADPLRFLTDFGTDYLDTARFYEDGGTPEMAQYLQEYDTKIQELKTRFPDISLQTSSELWNRVKSDAQEAERRVNVGANDFGGNVGGFFGGALGAMNPNTDPLNFATLTVGGVGKTAVGRIASQAGAQGVIEGVNQLTGVQEQRRLLGLDYGVGDALGRVTGAVVGGAVVQGFGEVVGAGVRKFFQNTPDDPAPPMPAPQRGPVAPVEPAAGVSQPLDVSVVPRGRQATPELTAFLTEVSPFGSSRAGRSRGLLDFEDVTAKLDTWDGGRPWEIAPKTDTAADNITVMNRSADIPDLSQHVATQEVDARARKVDPKIMQRYDQLATEKQGYRIRLEQEAQTRPEFAERDTALREVNAEINRLDDRIAKASAKNRKRLGGERDAKIAERDALVEQLNSTDTPNMAAMRSAMMRVDERMRDIAPAVSRAYARARGKWDANAADREAIVQMIRDGRKGIGSYEQTADFVDRAMTLADKAPILYRANEVQVKDDADAADVALAVLRKDMDDRAAALETSMAQTKALLASEDDVLAKVERPDDFTDEDAAAILEDSAKAYSDAHVAGVGEGQSRNKIALLDDKNLWMELDAKAESIRERVGALRKSGKTETVKISKLRTRQNWVENAKAGKSDSVPVVLRFDDGTLVVRDGNHKLNDIIAAGAKDVDAYVVDVKHSGTDWSTSPQAGLRIEGYEQPLRLTDDITVEGDDGNLRTITVRDMLQEQLDSQEDLAAVSSCSIL